MLWETLSEPWRACTELAWEAYCEGSLPIGAVVTDTEGNVLSRGRNRIFERTGDDGTLFGHRLAHAEMNALITLDHDGCEPDSCVLYTTCEPCPLCAGAIRMSGIGEFHYASRDTWAGSAQMFESVPYFKLMNVRAVGPQDDVFEMCQVALRAEWHLTSRDGAPSEFFSDWEKNMPEATRVGKQLYRSGSLERLREIGADASEALGLLSEEARASTGER